MLSVRFCGLLACGLVLLAVADGSAQRVSDDFAVELIYEAPEIEHPSTVTCDAAGNLFVGEDPMDMRGPSTQLMDRVLLIRWGHEGGPPVKTVFCENLSAVFGLLWYQDALYVMNAPYYTMLKDTDGDGIADMRKELCGTLGHPPGAFGLNNHVPAGMQLGMDGFVYIALGDKGLPKAIGADGSTITVEGGGVFRMRPDATQLETVSRGVRNNMDVALDRFDNIFGFDNDDDYGWWTRIIHHVPGGYYGYPYDFRSRRARFLPPVREFGSGTACGGACYREAVWPAPYQESVFFCDWGESKIDRYTLTKKGASFEATVEDFMLGDDSGSFRPIDLCFSPDGRHMYVADWNHSTGGTTEQVGRLYRVTYMGHDISVEPARANDDDPLQAQIQSLAHPAHAERMRAQQRLARFGQPVIEPVSQLLKSDEPSLVRVHALWTQNALMDELADYDPAPDWIAALRDSEPEVRAQAARALGTRRMKNAAAELANALKDTDAAVRMQSAIALGRIARSESAEALYAALHEPDCVARFTMSQALRAIGNWNPALPSLRASDAPTRAEVIETLTGVFDVGAVEVLNLWLQEAADPAERVAALQALAKVHRQADPYTGGWWGGKAAGGQPARPQQHAWAGTGTVLKAIVTGLQQDSALVRLAALEVLRDVPVPEALPQVRRMIAEELDDNVRLAAIRLLADEKDGEIVASLLRLMADDTARQPLRAAALQAIIALDAAAHRREIAELATAERAPPGLVVLAMDALADVGGCEAQQAIAKRLDDQQSELRGKAIEVYARVAADDLAARLAVRLQDTDMSVQRAALSALSIAADSADEASRMQLMTALAATPDARALPFYLKALVDNNETIRSTASKTLLALGDAIRDDLRKLHDRHELPGAVRHELAQVFGDRTSFAFLRESPPAKLEPAAYAKYATEHTGDPQRGQRLFADAQGIGCAKCHTVGGVGETDIGPNLLGIGAKYPRHELIRSVLEPSNRILIDFEMVVVATTSGMVHQGMLRHQTPVGVELVTADGKSVSIPAAEIEWQQTSNLSPMPNGLAEGMTLEDFADVIAYLESLTQPYAPIVTDGAR